MRDMNLLEKNWELVYWIKGLVYSRCYRSLEECTVRYEIIKGMVESAKAIHIDGHKVTLKAKGY